MKRQGMLIRSRVGVSGMAGMGFARWVWSYQLNPRYEALFVDKKLFVHSERRDDVGPFDMDPTHYNCRCSVAEMKK